MKTIVFLFSLFYLLQGGENLLYANTKKQNDIYSVKNEDIIKNKSYEFSNEDQKITLFDETDLDLEEDIHNSDDFNDLINTEFLISKPNILTPWYSSQAKLFVLNYFNNRFEISPPFLWVSYPIYISQRVLRI